VFVLLEIYCGKRASDAVTTLAGGIETLNVACAIAVEADVVVGVPDTLPVVGGIEPPLPPPHAASSADAIKADVITRNRAASEGAVLIMNPSSGVGLIMSEFIHKLRLQIG
jgi:hypothetical protein